MTDPAEQPRPRAPVSRGICWHLDRGLRASGTGEIGVCGAGRAALAGFVAAAGRTETLVGGSV